MSAHRSNFRGFGEIVGNKKAFLLKNHALNGNSVLKPVHKKKKKSQGKKNPLKIQYGFYAIKQLHICNKNSNIQDNGHMSDYKK